MWEKGCQQYYNLHSRFQAKQLWGKKYSIEKYCIPAISLARVALIMVNYNCSIVNTALQTMACQYFSTINPHVRFVIFWNAIIFGWDTQSQPRNWFFLLPLPSCSKFIAQLSVTAFMRQRPCCKDAQRFCCHCGLINAEHIQGWDPTRKCTFWIKCLCLCQCSLGKPAQQGYSELVLTACPGMHNNTGLGEFWSVLLQLWKEGELARPIKWVQLKRFVCLAE